jgi:hypothetical protein
MELNVLVVPLVAMMLPLPPASASAKAAQRCRLSPLEISPTSARNDIHLEMAGLPVPWLRFYDYIEYLN